MSQDSILELLSVTSNAVKALDKTSSSKSSGSGRGTPREEDVVAPPLCSRVDQTSRRSSGDSGVGKTASRSVTVKDKAKTDDGEDSDHSTTASDVLIRSTLAGPEDKMISLNSSAASHSSRRSDLDNFNIADAKKVKVSKKQLREIVSPRDSCDFKQPKDMSAEANLNRNFNNHGVADLNSNNSNNKQLRRGDTDDRIGKENRGKMINGLTGKVINSGVEKHSTGKGSSYPLANSKHAKDLPSKTTGSSTAAYTVERHPDYQKRAPTQDFPPEWSQRDGQTVADLKPSGGPASYESKHVEGSKPSSHQALYESKHAQDSKQTVTRTSVEMEDQPEDWEEGEAESVTSSQPEIVTIPERVVNISSQALLPSEDDDSVSLSSAVDKVSQANKAQSFPRAQPSGPGLKQGALMQGQAMSRIDRKDEVQISKFALTEKQRELRDALAKRGSQSKPVKRVVHAKVVESRASSVSEEGNKNNNMDMDDGGGSARGTVGNVESITAAVAASAAVAATQPFLKLQQELEAKMQTLLAEMDRIQKGASTGATAESQNVTNTGTRRMEYLEQQVQELTERRLQHLETLQNQQMEMQAHLLSMSRGMSQQQARYPSNMPSTTYPTAINLGTSRQQPYSRPFIEHQLAQGRMFGEQGGVEKQAGGCQHDDGGPKGSLLDTPAPREKPPRPVEYGGSKGSGLLHEILAAEPSPQLNTTFSLPPGHTPPVKLGRSRRQDGGSPVDKARKLVHDLSTLEDQTAESIWNDPKKTARYRLPADEPAPLEFYLKRVRDPNSTPYSKLVKTKREESSSVSRSSGKTSRDAPVVNKFEDAHTVLRSIVAKRQTLENNLDLLLRSRQDVDVYTLLGVAGAGSNSSEMNHIRKMVEKRISSLRDEVKREVEWDSRHAVTKGTQPNSYQESRKGTRGTAGKPVVGFGSGAPRMSKIDSGLGKTQPLSDTITQPTKGKRLVKSRPAPKKSKIPYNDEAVMTKIYGKAQYQKGRTTMRDPYLHYQNQAKPRASRIPSPKRVDSTMDVKSSKTQTMGGVGGQLYDDGTTAGGPRQFYFTPNTGYVPLTSSAPAPVAGQLIPVAVPLGKPRMEPGLAVGRETLPHSLPPTSSAPIRPVVTAATNVAMVAMTEGGEVQAERVPELGKQVLPTVDIDSMSPTSSPRGSDIQINKPDTSRNAGYTQTFHFQDSEDEGEMDKTLTEYDSDEEQQGTGISLPGYHPPRPAQDAARPHSPDRAPHNVRFQGSKPQLRDEGRVPWEERCDELAEDLRTRDILQNRAKYWLEQELMARMLIQMYPTFSAQAEQQVDQADADKSESIPDDESLLVGDTIGREGLQLFVDAGQPVDNKLVNALVREVIAERVGGMLGRGREADAASASRAAGSAATATTHGRGAAADVEMEPEFVRPSRQPERVPTPQPTPRTSPIPGYISQHTAPTTPPLTPPSSPKEQRKREEMREVVAPVEVQMASQAQQAVVESDTEASASLDISEELRALDEKLKPRQTFAAALLQSQPQFRHDVVTPTTTPPPSPPPQPAERPRERTPTPSPPPHQPAVEPVQPPAPPPPPQLAPPSPKKEDVQAKSPQPWGNPDSPVPELNPNYEEPEDLQHTQPKPLMMSKAVGTGPQMEERRSPSPQRQRTTSTDQSELDSVSTSSSPSDTFNDNISEGQWLVSRSEGQVAGLPLDEGVHRLAMEAARKVDVSTASTLRDTDDIDLDDTDVSRSEGEFRHKGDGNPETDPVLALMLQMQRQPGGFRQYDLPAERVQHVLNITGRSVGEVTRNGQGSPTRKSMGEMSEGQVLPGNRVTVVTPKVVEQQHDVERRAYQPQQQVTRDDQGRHENRAGRSSPSDHRAANKHRSKSPSLNARGRQLQYQPVSSGLPPAKSQSRQPLKSALVKSGSEEFRHSRDSDPDSDRRGPATEYGTRTLTPDQLNTDALLRSGSYINASRSMNSTGRQGSTKKSVEFDLTGTYEMSRRDSWRGSDDYTGGSSDHLSNSGRSSGLRYSFEDSGSDRHRQSSDGSFLRMSVTLPTTEGADMDSDVSEIDLSEGPGK